ncbi:MAG: nuclear transport factor 2 family protein [Myxococcota bacterium]
MLTPSELADRAEITQLLYRYARAIDDVDLESLERVFTPDAWIEYRTIGGRKGRFPEMVRWLGESLPIFKATQHAISNPLIDLAGDRATSTCTLRALHVQVEHDGREHRVIQYAAYHDEHRRTGSGWRIAKRVLETVYNDGHFLGPDRIQIFARAGRAEPRP